MQTVVDVDAGVRQSGVGHADTRRAAVVAESLLSVDAAKSVAEKSEAEILDAASRALIKRANCVLMK